MPYLVGTDEAGYGPNLGPLVISATVWRVESLENIDLFSRLRRAVRSVTDDENAEKVTIADSKDLYRSGKGLAGLEQGVLTCLAAVNKRPRTWRKIWDELAADSAGGLTELPWYRDFDDRLPVDVQEKDVSRHAEEFVLKCEHAKCVPIRIESRAVFPNRFNELVQRHGNKASALSHTTLQLVRSELDLIPAEEPVHILCDKHGGRNKYGRWLKEIFPDTQAMIRCEGRGESAYQLGYGNQRREIVFRAKGERFLPSALASMVSKYLRELAMRAFNEYWTGKVRGLKPTAGYPMDAKRFKEQIAPMQKKLGIDDQILWRCR